MSSRVTEVKASELSVGHMYLQVAVANINNGVSIGQLLGAHIPPGDMPITLYLSPSSSPRRVEVYQDTIVEVLDADQEDDTLSSETSTSEGQESESFTGPISHFGSP